MSLRARLCRFQLRTLLIAMTVCCLALVRPSMQLSQFRQSARANRQLNELGAHGKVELADAPRWVGWLLGEERFVRIVEVSNPPWVETNGQRFRLDLGNGHRHGYVVSWPTHVLDDRVLEACDGIETIQSIIIRESKITDQGFRHLQGMTNLKVLRIRDIPLSDNGIANLSRLTSLTHLELGTTEITDRGLAFVAGLTQLEELHIRSRYLTDAGISHLKDLRNLQSLTIGGPGITDRSLETISKLQNIVALNVAGTQISGEGFRHWAGHRLSSLHLGLNRIADGHLFHLQHLPSLRELSLGEPDVTDKGIEHLRLLTRLTALRLRTGISERGAAILKESLPNCNRFEVVTYQAEKGREERAAVWSPEYLSR